MHFDGDPALQQVFDERGFLLLPMGSIKPHLYRLYRTVSLLKMKRWMRLPSRYWSRFARGRANVLAKRSALSADAETVVQLADHEPPSGAKPDANANANTNTNANLWGQLDLASLAQLDKQAHQLSLQLPASVLTVLNDTLKVGCFGQTQPFDHLEFSAWFNGFFAPGEHVQSVLYEAYSALFSRGDPSVQPALDQWVLDLGVMADFVLLMQQYCRSLTGNVALNAEHVHLKSWQARGYKAQWWHLDRGQISAIATIAGFPTTEILLGEDPTPYPSKAEGDDVFVFPETLTQTIHHVPADDLLICGARERKERQQSYLWHRAPDSPVERIVVVMKSKTGQ